MSRSLEQRLEDIQSAIDKCFEYQKFLGKPDTELMALDAIIRNIEIIGEAVRHLPDSFKASHPEIPWHEVVGMRNFLAHQYFSVLEGQIRSVVENDLRDVEVVIQRSLGGK